MKLNNFYNNKFSRPCEQPMLPIYASAVDNNWCSLSIRTKLIMNDYEGTAVFDFISLESVVFINLVFQSTISR